MKEQAKKKELSLSDLAEMRKTGLVKDSEELIAEKRAIRAEKKAQRASEMEVKRTFPDHETAKNFLRQLAAEIRTRRKAAVDAGITNFSLPETITKPLYMAFEKLPYNKYRTELGDLSIEGLKVQDREVKAFIYQFNDKLLESGFVDWGWITRMLSKKYVSRYGWKLLRKHSESLTYGGAIIGYFLEEWAQDPETRKKWKRLAFEDGKPEDMRKLFPR